MRLFLRPRNFFLNAIFSFVSISLAVLFFLPSSVCLSCFWICCFVLDLLVLYLCFMGLCSVFFCVCCLRGLAATLQLEKDWWTPETIGCILLCTYKSTILGRAYWSILSKSSRIYRARGAATDTVDQRLWGSCLGCHLGFIPDMYWSKSRFQFSFFPIQLFASNLVATLVIPWVSGAHFVRA